MSNDKAAIGCGDSLEDAAHRQSMMDYANALDRIARHSAKSADATPAALLLLERRLSALERGQRFIAHAGATQEPVVMQGFFLPEGSR